MRSALTTIFIFAAVPAMASETPAMNPAEIYDTLEMEYAGPALINEEITSLSAEDLLEPIDQNSEEAKALLKEFEAEKLELDEMISPLN